MRIIPYLVAMFIAIRVFQQSGAMESLISLINPLTSIFPYIPKEVLPLALIRPLSGTGALGILGDLLATHARFLYWPTSLNHAGKYRNHFFMY